MKIDETDKKIIRVLVENARLSYREIAKKVGVSVATIMHRVNALEDEKRKQTGRDPLTRQ